MRALLSVYDKRGLAEFAAGLAALGWELVASGGTAAELTQLCRRPEPVLCYEVEVCPECAWHHLMRKYPGGGPKGRRRSKVAP